MAQKYAALEGKKEVILETMRQDHEKKRNDGRLKNQHFFGRRLNYEKDHHDQKQLIRFT